MTDESPAVVPEHIRTPHARPLQPLPVNKDDKQFVALRDPAMLVSQSMVINPQALNLIQQFQGEHTIEEIASKFLPAERLPEGADRSEHLRRLGAEITKLASTMDSYGLLWGPTFTGFEARRTEQLQKHGAFPLQASGSLVALARENDPEHAEMPEEPAEQEAWACGLATDQLATWLEETEDPEFDVAPIGIVVPHLDYARGGELSAAAYRAWVDQPAPDRVVVLGTNHFGMGDGVVASPYNFQTPLGHVSADENVWTALHAKLGDRLYKDQLDLVPEHSIELHLPWIQHLFGDVPVVAALIPDPLTPPIEDDGGRVTAAEFTTALKDVLQEQGGLTYFIASADLSHVGPQFGEPKPIDDQRREEVERIDRELIGHYLANDGASFIEAMEWSKNATRWCSIGNMCAVADLAGADEIEFIDYRQACDEKGTGLVSAAAVALLADRDAPAS
jgi:AmmeMemoRadiSam system protein B